MTEEELQRLREEGDQPAPMFEVRVCARPECGKPLVRRPKERPNRFELRKYCSQQCNQTAAKANLTGRGGPARVPARECERDGCDTVFTGRRRQRFCSFDCAMKASAVTVENRQCARPDCDVVLVRRPGERQADFRDRKFCSESCRRRRADAPERVCARRSCDALLVRRERETHAEFVRRLFCSRECASAARAGVPRPSHAVPPRRKPKPVVVKAPAGLTVFGDKPPVEPWRPGSWRSAS